MKWIAVIFLTLGWLNPARTQSRVFEDQVWNFGDINFWNNDTALFTVQNATEKDLIFLPTYYSENFWVFFSSRKAGPGESIKVGIVYYTEVKGKFNEAIPLYINLRAEPITFRLKGNIKGFDPMAQVRCPMVNAGAEENKVEKVIIVEVRDLNTDEVLMPDDISIRTRGNQKMHLVREGMEFKMSAAPGAYRVEATKAGYHNYLALITLESYQLKFIVYMEKNGDELPDLEVEVPDLPVTNRNPEKVPDSVELSLDKNEHIHPPDTLPVITRTEAPGGELSTEAYRLNNIILIVDVSSSMNRGGKFDALKSSFNVLVDALRPDDLVTVISMASNASIVQNTTGVIMKDSLKARLAAVKPLGGTNGGAALQMAYQLAAEHFIPGGNNQVIIATDGVFYGGTLTRREIEALVEKGNTEGIHLSSVAFGSDPKAMLFLGNLAQKGGGGFIQITDINTQEAGLLEMIKNQSKR